MVAPSLMPKTQIHLLRFWLLKFSAAPWDCLESSLVLFNAVKEHFQKHEKMYRNDLILFDVKILNSDKYKLGFKIIF